MESPQHSGSQRRVLFGRLLYREVVHVKPPARCGRHHRRCRVALLPQRRQELGPVVHRLALQFQRHGDDQTSTPLAVGSEDSIREHLFICRRRSVGWLIGRQK